MLDQSRIKDLRTGVETGNTQAVLDGGLDMFIEASLKSGNVNSTPLTQGIPEMTEDENKLIAQRREKLSQIRARIAFSQRFQAQCGGQW